MESASVGGRSTLQICFLGQTPRRSSSNGLQYLYNLLAKAAGAVVFLEWAPTLTLAWSWTTTTVRDNSRG